MAVVGVMSGRPRPVPDTDDRILNRHVPDRSGLSAMAANSRNDNTINGFSPTANTPCAVS